MGKKKEGSWHLDWEVKQESADKCEDIAVDFDASDGDIKVHAHGDIPMLDQNALNMISHLTQGYLGDLAGAPASRPEDHVQVFRRTAMLCNAIADIMDGLDDDEEDDDDDRRPWKRGKKKGKRK